MNSWNAIGKHWLQKYDNKFGGFFFFVNGPILKVQILHPFENTIETLYKHGTYVFGSCSTESKNDILDNNIFGNSDIKFNRNPLFFQSFFINNIFIINDVSGKKIKTCVENQTMLKQTG